MNILFPAPGDIAAIFDKIRKTHIGILGDFCVDAYFEIDGVIDELSIETGKRVQQVRRQRYSPGGGGNVVVNLRALEVQHIAIFGVVGDDMFGRELHRMFLEMGADCAALLVQPINFATPVYGKPLLDGVEQQRLDFGSFNQVSDETWDRLLPLLLEAHQQVDFLIINQQLPRGWCSDERATQLRQLLQTKWSGRHLVDTRDHLSAFKGVAFKLNQYEATRLLSDAPAATRTMRQQYSDSDALQLAGKLAQHSIETQFITRGESGILACTSNGTSLIPGVQIVGPVDPVGAGDATTAMLAACRAAHIASDQSAVMANLAASITVRKLNQTGTATEAELVSALESLAYVHHPTLAGETRRAQYAPETDLELVESAETIRNLKCERIRYAIFDHDGTISTLRQGWESIMEPVMMRAILGDTYESTSTNLFATVRDRVRQYIEHSTGIQTITQMDALTGMIHEFGIVPVAERLDAWGYKRVYNEALMSMVRERIQRIETGELEASDFIMKGVLRFLHVLRDHNITLILVSGTDEEDTKHEAALLGYADLFNGGIFGALPGSRSDMKREIILRVIKTITESDSQAVSPSAGYIVIGDGPVEIKLGRRYGGLTLGIASSEERRFGLNQIKRNRLIRAGAHLIVPDFAQWKQLATYILE